MALYRSKIREEPRVITPLCSSPFKSEYESGIFHYTSNDFPFSEIYEKAKSNNKNALLEIYSNESRSIIESIDDLYTIASKYIWVIYNWPDSRPNPAQHVLFPCFHKSLLSLYTSHDLTMSGLYGPARPHLRHVFESLMIAKFCSCNHESDVFDRWVDGEDLYFTNSVIKKITHPDSEEILTAWKILCEWSHSTVYANQPDLASTDAKKEALLNFSFTEIFLQWTYHLLSRHIITSTVRYYGNRYAKSNRHITATNRLRNNFKWQSQFLAKASRRLITDYKSTWKTI